MMALLPNNLNMQCKLLANPSMSLNLIVLSALKLLLFIFAWKLFKNEHFFYANAIKLS